MPQKGRVLIYTIDGCRYCATTKAKLEDLNIKYDEVNITKYPARLNEMITLTKQHTVPQIFFNDLHIGGNRELFELSEDDLNALLDEIMNELPSDEAPQPINESDVLQNANNQEESLKDEDFVELISDIDTNLSKSNRKKLLMTFDFTLTGIEFVDYLVKEKQFEQAKAISIGSSFVDKKILNSVYPTTGIKFKYDDVLYQFLEHRDSVALNTGLPAYKKIENAENLALMVRSSILHLFDLFLSKDGLKVDYDGIKASDKFTEFQFLASHLQRIDVENLSREQKIAFFINIYNVMVIEGNIVLGTPSSKLQRINFFSNTKYNIGGLEYSLQDIENGILRANRKGVLQLTVPFGSNDPRLKVSLTEHEPLVHFALVCGAKSCPAVRVYSSQNVMEELQIATSGFLESDDNFSVIGEHVKLNAIFKWYSVDFGNTDLDLLKFIVKYLPESKKKRDLEKMIKKNLCSISYFNYNWDTNK